MTENLQWRDNLHDNIRQVIYGGRQDIGLAQVIIDAIDAAYVQGLEVEKESQLEKEKIVYEQGLAHSRRLLIKDLIKFVEDNGQEPELGENEYLTGGHVSKILSVDKFTTYLKTLEEKNN